MNRRSDPIFSGRLIGFLLPLAALGIFEIAFRIGDLQGDTLAAPSKVLGAFVASVTAGALVRPTIDTLITVFGGLAIGGLAGLTLGLLFGSVPTLDKLFTFPVEIVRPIPSVALIPISMLVAGFGYSMEIAVVSFAAAWPVLITTKAAIAEVEPRLLEVARVLRLGFVVRTCKIVIPASLPRIFVGFRLAAGIALIVAVTVEIAANPIGLGYAIISAQQSLQPALMLAFLFWIGLIGLILNSSLIFLQKRLFGRAVRPVDSK